MIDLIGKRNYFFALSILIILSGALAYFIHGGFNLDIQFSGGTIIQVQLTDSKFDKSSAADKTKIEDKISKAINKKVSAQSSYTFNAKNNNTEYFVNVSVANKGLLTTEEQSTVLELIKSDLNTGTNPQISVDNIQPSIGQELLSNGLKAIFWSSLLIILYVWIRFKVMSGLSAGVMAVLALLHDALIMLSVYTIFQIPLNESFIAAVLTVIGYSMNDTIIIYDRVRENSNLLRKVPIGELVNRSILQTLNRSINTVVTVLISITTVYLFAKFYNIPSIENFSFPLIIGIASGCYSSIFIASPLWVIWKMHLAKKNTNVKSKPARA